MVAARKWPSSAASLLASRVAVVAWLAGLAPGGLGCGHAGASFAQELAQVQYPPWILRGSGPYKAAEARAFYGVGQVAGMRNVALARSSADNRARAELAKSFEMFAAGVLAAYVREQDAQASGRGAGGRQEPEGISTVPGGITLVAKAEEMSSEQLVKALAAAALPSVQVVEHWFHPNDGAVFSLARLELGAVVDNLGRMRELRPALRAWLQSHLQAQHDAVCAAKARHDAEAEPLAGG